MRTLIQKILFLVLLCVVCVPFIVTAQTPAGSYIPLVDLPGVATSNAKGAPITFATYIPGMFRLFIGIAGALAVLMIVIGGLEYITSESLGGKKDGKEKLNNAIIGLLLAIGAFSILSTIDPKILVFDLNSVTTPKTPAPVAVAPSCPVSPCGSYACATDQTCTVKANCSKECQDKNPQAGVARPCAGSACFPQFMNGSPWPSDASERAQLAGIEIIGTGKRTQCTTVGESGCTSVYKVGNKAISGLLRLKNQCPSCLITVTGGSEFWEHVTHGIGMNVVDLQYRANDTLTRFITQGRPGQTSNNCIKGQPSWSTIGAIFVLENNNHWHVCFTQFALSPL